VRRGRGVGGRGGGAAGGQVRSRRRREVGDAPTGGARLSVTGRQGKVKVVCFLQNIRVLIF
jgi:hypothetical protein